MKTSKELYQELVQEPFWNTNINPIVGYEVPSMSNYNARVQALIPREERQYYGRSKTNYTRSIWS